LGCKKNSPQSDMSDSVVHVLDRIVNNSVIPIEAKKRAESSLLLWKNRVVDKKPILIHAVLEKHKGIDETILTLIIYDEDKDTSGFVISEECLDANDVKSTLQEDYPAYVHNPPPAVADAYWFEVNVRDNHQRKDDKQWKEYTSKSLEELAKNHIQNDPSSEESFEPMQYWRETIPPIWVSIPEKNNVDVWIHVYDEAGHKSEPVKLLNQIND